MQARCPHCSNVFNTERAGVQFCPNCGQQINVPDPAGPPPPPPPGAPGAPPGAPPGSPGPAAFARGPVPWEERAQRGAFSAFFENWKMVFTQPEQFWTRLRPDGPISDALFFGWIIFAINGLLNIPLQLVSAAINRNSMNQVMDAAKDLPPEVRRVFQQYMGVMLGGGAAGILIGEIIIYPVFLIIGSAILHVLAMIFGTAKNGFNATVRVVAYASAPYILGWIPCCGGLVAAVYTTVLTIWGLARAHDSTTVRAALAVLAPLVLVCCCVGGAAVLAAMAGASAANAH